MASFKDKAERRMRTRTLKQQYAGTFRLKKLRSDFGKRRKKNKFR